MAKAKVKAVIVHKDIIGNIIKEGDAVVSPHGTYLHVGIVEKLNPKMVTVKLVAHSGWRSSAMRYPSELLVVEDPKVTLYLLQYQKD